ARPRRIDTFPDSSILKIAREAADGYRPALSNASASATNLWLFWAAAFIPAAICSGVSLPLYWSSFSFDISEFPPPVRLGTFLSIRPQALLQQDLAKHIEEFAMIPLGPGVIRHCADFVPGRDFDCE